MIKTSPTGADYAKLNTLARQIRSGNEATNKLIEQSKDHANAALTEAILMGNTLHEVQRIVGSAGFERWIYDHAGVDRDFCKQVMKLATVPVTDLNRDFLQLGIIEKPTAKVNRS